jgi:hypothetical protein
MAGVMKKCPFNGIPDFRMPPEIFCGGVTCFHPIVRSSNEDFHRKGAEVAEETLRRVCISGYCRAFFTAIPFHPLGEPSSSIGFQLSYLPTCKALRSFATSAPLR